MTKDTFTSDRREHVTSFLFLFLFRVHDDSSSCGRMSVLECREIIFVENFIVIYLSRFRFLPTELSVCGGTVNFSRLGGFNHSISDVAFANFLKYTWCWDIYSFVRVFIVLHLFVSPFESVMLVNFATLLDRHIKIGVLFRAAVSATFEPCIPARHVTVFVKIFRRNELIDGEVAIFTRSRHSLFQPGRVCVWVCFMAQRWRKNFDSDEKAYDRCERGWAGRTWEIWKVPT